MTKEGRGNDESRFRHAGLDPASSGLHVPKGHLLFNNQFRFVVRKAFGEYIVITL